MKIDVYFNKISVDPAKEIIAQKLCMFVAEFVSLPNHIEVEFKPMDMSTYGETLVLPTINKRIRINGLLSIKEMFYPIVHELLHLHQTHTGMLTVRRDGIYIWNSRPYHIRDSLSHSEYTKLPWEVDVTKKEKKILEQVLDKFSGYN